MVARRIATLWLLMVALAVGAAARGEGDGDRSFLVVVDDLEVLTEPSDSAYSTGSLKRGDRVVVLSNKNGWATIQPPAGTFNWVSAAEVREQPDGSCLVSANRTKVRFAADSAKMPGPPLRTLEQGDSVRLLDHLDLKVGNGASERVWRAIEPSRDEVRFLRSDGIETSGSTTAKRPEASEPAERLVAYHPEPPPADLPAEVNAELGSITAMIRSIKSDAVDRWDLGSVRGRYESLLRQYADNPSVKAAVQPRLDQVVRDIEVARAARKLDQILQEGDQRDAEVEQLRSKLVLARSRSERKYDAQGFLQASSRRYQGQRVHALIGPEGRPVSYLSIPPGVPISRYLARKVGVRGIVHFDEDLGARLISVRDLELIEKNR